jgi:hypothetical protein
MSNGRRVGINPYGRATSDRRHLRQGFPAGLTKSVLGLILVKWAGTSADGESGAGVAKTGITMELLQCVRMGWD